MLIPGPGPQDPSTESPAITTVTCTSGSLTAGGAPMRRRCRRRLDEEDLAAYLEDLEEEIG